jgi:hypothetical protein
MVEYKCYLPAIDVARWQTPTAHVRAVGIVPSLCPFAVYYLRYATTSLFTISRIPLTDSKRAGQKVQRKIAVAVQNVKTLYFLSRSFEIIYGKRP